MLYLDSHRTRLIRRRGSLSGEGSGDSTLRSSCRGSKLHVETRYAKGAFRAHDLDVGFCAGFARRHHRCVLQRRLHRAAHRRVCNMGPPCTESGPAGGAPRGVQPEARGRAHGSLVLEDWNLPGHMSRRCEIFFCGHTTAILFGRRLNGGLCMKSDSFLWGAETPLVWLHRASDACEVLVIDFCASIYCKIIDLCLQSRVHTLTHPLVRIPSSLFLCRLCSLCPT
jgi:hypothetical protein